MDGHEVVVVLGHPGYDSRFGFVPASTLGLRCTWDVPDDVFMALMLQGVNGSKPVGGSVHDVPEFDEL